MNSKIKKYIFWVLILFVILLLTFFVSIISGSENIFNKDISILKDLLLNRFPRIIIGFAVGGSLSISGVILQSIFKNSLVEPYTLGISGGAGIGVSIGILLKLNRFIGSFSFFICGILGAIIIVMIIYFLSSRKKIIKVQGLLLIGVMISFICSSIMMLLMSLTKIEDLKGIIFWIMGSLDESNLILIFSSPVLALTGLVISCFYSVTLNALYLGEEEAFHLGINVERVKKILLLIASILTGFSVSVTGIIGFVGLIIPLLCRLILGNDHRILLISSFLGGAIFLILSDTIARIIISPIELPVGVITGIFGGVILIILLVKKGN